MNLQNRSRLTERTALSLPRNKKGGRGMDWEFGVGRYKLLHLEYRNGKVLLYSTGNYIQYSVINHSIKECGKDVCVWTYICVCVCIYIYIHTYIYIYLNHFAIHQKLIQHWKSTILQ